MSPQVTITETQLIAETPRIYETSAESSGLRWLCVRQAWLELAESQLDAIAMLSEDWDGDGASSPDMRNLQTARRLLTLLCCAQGVAKPHINPTRSGGVQFEWEEGARYFEVEVVAERAVTYLYQDEDAGEEETGVVFEGDLLDRLVQYIWQVGSGSTGDSSRCEGTNVVAVA